MILTGTKIEEYVNRGIIGIEPFDPKQLNPNSYNVRLHNTLKVYKNNILDARSDNHTEEFEIPSTGIILQPGVLYLGRTVELTSTKPISAEEGLVIVLDGRSSLARLGISCHISAGYGDVGFEGTFTCEITCVHPVRIYPDMLIGQVYYIRTYGNTDIQYKGKYQGQIDATSSRFFIDIDK